MFVHVVELTALGVAAATVSYALLLLAALRLKGVSHLFAPSDLISTQSTATVATAALVVTHAGFQSATCCLPSQIRRLARQRVCPHVVSNLQHGVLLH
jgi:hypothetical protein